MRRPIIDTLPQFIAKHAQPVLESSGFEIVDGLFCLTSPRGDSSLIGIRPYPLDASVVFTASLAVCPAPYWQWVMRRADDIGHPDMSGGLVRYPIAAPRAVAHRPDDIAPMNQRWSYNDDSSADKCGQVLAQVLIEEVVPKATRLLNRQELLAEVRDPDADYIPGMSGKARLEAILLVDDTAPDDIEALLTDVEEYSPEDNFIEWVRLWAGRRR
ncbi:hypothetical protein GCM10009839_45180 [Catenulispora yoronensis]|uniref:DUF4304 domain-containing protein n=1 Tax=Catenulispora yoronensis TaxID=450799 RepID=A0ABN2UJR6_9ACTN